MKNRKFVRVAALSVALVCFVSLAFLVTASASRQDRRIARASVERAIDRFDELTLDPAAVLRDARKSGRLTLDTSRGSLELEVEPFDIRSDNYRSVAVGEDGVMRDLPRTPSRSWRGKVAGQSETFVRLVLDDTVFEGIVVTPDETYFVESERHFSEAAGTKDFVFYAASSVKQQDVGECGTTLAQKVGAESSRTPLDTTHAAKGVTADPLFAPKPEAEVATEADFEFTSTRASAQAANDDIANIMTLVDGLYDRDLGIKIRIVFQRAFTSNNDPYTVMTDPRGALNEFRSVYDGSFGTNPVPARDLTHMFTGKSFGGTIGIAFISAICDAPGFAYGLSHSNFTNDVSLRVGLTAHEMGHNFGASHTGPSQNPADPPQQIPGCDQPNAAIMQPFISSFATGFCQFSRDEITDHTANFSDCLTRVGTNGCTYTLSSGSRSFPVAGGSSSVSVTAGAGCGWTASEGATWFTVTSGQSGTGPGTVSFSVDANTTNTGPRASAIDIGGQKLNVFQAASASCASTPIGIGQSLNGNLATSDCVAGQPGRPNAFTDLYTFVGRAGQRVKIEMTGSGNLEDTFLYLFGPDGSIAAFNDDIDTNGENFNSRIPISGFFALPATGVYTIDATSFDNNVTGGYTLALTDNSAASNVALSSSAFSVSEGVGGNGLGTDGTGFRVVTLSRSGDVSGTATVDFATSDGSADRRKDYEQTLGTLVFGPGETSKSFTVLIPDDRFSEAPETINITLSNPVGMTLGSPSTATLTINSDDATSTSSPVQAASFDNRFYVRQQYLDFLNREPDLSGFNFWTGDLNSCSTEPCREVHRINVSAAFFLSIEFQNTGFLVERMYKVAYGDATGTSTFPNVHQLAVPVVRHNEFLPDSQRIAQGVVVGEPGANELLEANKQAFALEFVLRQRFLNDYPLTMTPAQFVDQMNTRAGNVLTQTERDQLVAQLTASSNVAAGRASVLRSIAENAVLTQNERNKAFVLMQFFGYLRRNPNDAPDADYTGFDFWLQKLNQFNGNFVQAEMVKSFLVSTEYIDRFGTRP